MRSITTMTDRDALFALAYGPDARDAAAARERLEQLDREWVSSDLAEQARRRGGDYNMPGGDMGGIIGFGCLD